MHWHVTGQRPVTKPGQGMQVVEGYDVTVETDTGHTDTVFVPAGAYTPDGVTRAVNATLTRVAAIDGLEGDV